MTLAPDTGLLERLTAHGARFLIRGASIVSMDPSVGDLARGDILVAGGTIEAVGAELADAVADGQAIEVDATGTIAIPGLQDTHRHSWQAQMRRLRPDGDLGGYIELLHF